MARHAATPRAELVLLGSLAALATLPPGAPAPAPDWNGVDAGSFVPLLRRHGFAPYACHLLQGRGLLSSAPPPVAAALLRELKGTTVVNLSLLAESRRLLAAIAAAGLTAVPLKGASLIGSVYPLPGLRPMDDIDLLIRREELPAVRKVVEASGWRLPPGASAEAFAGYHFHLPLVRRGVPFRLELHWRLADDESIAEAVMARIWERIAASGTPPALDPAAALVYQAVHLAKHGFMNAVLARDPALRGLSLEPVTGNRLIWFVDIRLLMARGGDGLAAEAIALASRWGLLPPLHDAAALCDHLFGPLPGWAWPADLAVGAAPWPKRALVGHLARGLARRSAFAGGVVDRLSRMDHRLELRPARALDLLDPLLPDGPTVDRWRRDHGPLAVPFLRAGRAVTGSARVIRRGWQVLRALAGRGPGGHP